MMGCVAANMPLVGWGVVGHVMLYIDDWTVGVT
jgi:hypothetical protein